MSTASASRRSADRAGASARARSRELAAAERGRLLRASAAGGAALGLLGLLLVGWRVGIAGALWGAAAVLLWQRRTGDAHRWAKGAAGERRTARLLRPLGRRGYTVLHDRSIPGSRANLDHLVIGPCGVVLVDSKNWNSKRVIKGRGRRFRAGRVGGRTVTGSVLYERDCVARRLLAALGEPVPVVPVLAVHGAKVSPWRPVVTNGVRVLGARAVRGWIKRQPAQLDPARVAVVAQECDRLFPPYSAN